MLRLISGIALAFFLATGAQAQEKKATAQQERMKDCNAQASQKEMKGEARKDFMSSCLKGDAAAGGTKATAQQERMKDCNKEASSKELKGDKRQQFMSTCLRG